MTKKNPKWVELFKKIFEVIEEDFLILCCHFEGFVFWVLFSVLGTALVLRCLSTKGITSSVTGKFSIAVPFLRRCYG